MTSAVDRSLSPQEAAQVFVTPAAYADEQWFHDACTVLRREEPIHLVEHPDFAPFWVLTKHADVLEVELHPNEFRNAPRPVLQNHEADARQAEQGELLRTLIHMDAPDHRVIRAITADWFLPKSMARLEGRLQELAQQSVATMIEHGGRCDFARDIAMPFPLQVILAILGLPESDYPRMLTLTQELFGAADPELARGEQQTLEDLVAVINGEPLGPMETISYYVIIATAGHDTTASAMAGGLLALIQHPEQLARLQADPSLIPTAVDEIIRWVTPVKHFMRNVVEPYELRGHRFEPGDTVLLSYPSANRDDEVFDDPFRFDVGRAPNKHLAFGFGVHYCLGAMLARMEIRALLAELLPRLRSIDLDGDPKLMQTLFVGGVKRLPVSYRI
jgi:cytochrome P450